MIIQDPGHKQAKDYAWGLSSHVFVLRLSMVWPMRVEYFQDAFQLDLSGCLKMSWEPIGWYLLWPADGKLWIPGLSL